MPQPLPYRGHGSAGALRSSAFYFLQSSLFMSQTTIIATVADVLSIMLAAVFAWAAVAKLRHPLATAAAFRSLRLPASDPLSRLVPVIEIVVSVGVLVVPRFGAALMLALLVAFTVVLHRARQSGEVRCGCFGAADTQPVTWVTFVRNFGLGFLSLFVVIASRRIVGSPFSTSIGGVVVVLTSAVTVAVVGATVIALFDMRQRIGAVFSQEQHR